MDKPKNGLLVMIITAIAVIMFIGSIRNPDPKQREYKQRLRCEYYRCD